MLHICFIYVVCMLYIYAEVPNKVVPLLWLPQETNSDISEFVSWPFSGGRVGGVLSMIKGGSARPQHPPALPPTPTDPTPRRPFFCVRRFANRCNGKGHGSGAFGDGKRALLSYVLFPRRREGYVFPPQAPGMREGNVFPPQRLGNARVRRHSIYHLQLYAAAGDRPTFLLPRQALVPLGQHRKSPIPDPRSPITFFE